ncbi:hypothetical protein L3X38_024877 [Prunus dulcis]|uniref:Uncharacterized protein n=1 Tax=Prunus dulcis TaxID=3755 RepID=A0AAD4W277_PRUDU|nr:hypothetical protein L3X38_024877 [Prunus dulcis]
MYDSDYVEVVDVDDDEEDDVDRYEEDDVVEASGEASLLSVPIYDDSGDESDKEIYDEENDAALEDDNMFMHNVQIPKNYNSDGFGSPPNSDDEGQRPRYPKFNAKIDMENPQFEVSMLFASKKELREAISHYAINEGYEPKMRWRLFQALIKREIRYEDLGPVNKHGWTFISYQQKGLDVAFDLVVPEAAH